MTRQIAIDRAVKATLESAPRKVVALVYALGCISTRQSTYKGLQWLLWQQCSAISKTVALAVEYRLVTRRYIGGKSVVTLRPEVADFLDSLGEKP